MKAFGYSLPFIVLLCGATAMIGLIKMRKAPEQAERIEKTALVNVATVKACSDGFHIYADGEVIPYREISLAAQVGGRIAKKSQAARAGNYVRVKDLLFQIDPRDYELEVRRLQETVKQAGSSIEESDVEKSNVTELVILAEQQLQLQRSESARLEGLRKRNAASTSQIEKARQTELQSLNSLQTLKNQITMVGARRARLLQEKQRAMAALDLASLNLDRTKIVAPLNGVVIQDFAEEDDFVQPGTRLIRLEDRSKVEVRFSLRMDQLRWLWNSQTDLAEPKGDAAVYEYQIPKVPVEVQIEAEGNHFSWPATLDRYDGAGIDPRTRTVPVIAVVDRPNAVRVRQDENAIPLGSPPTLLRGSYVTVDLLVGKTMPLLSMPANAYRPNKTVWIYRDGLLAIQPVKIAYSDDRTAIFLANTTALQPGDQVITSPLPVAEEDMKLQISEQ